MKNVMTRAWEIARKAAAKFGGRAREYMASALRQAWAETRGGYKVTIELTVNRRKGQTWVARILGKHDVFRFDREFVSAVYDKDGESVWRLTASVYEICEVGKRYFVRVEADDYVRIKTDEVLEEVA
ncbi:hypothetical protein PACILC2_22620 [Paenibacillus cisolokensis]|uniref:Phage protein n=1 Tax=Paenibacillus cisolokensis TaxID=1658519 RepID=A0ABQ4N6C3_9BACL|nr:hypothetical protein [Paenibacillus cisolokensis]GIQ63694.1 hypothetical protein PACILC2_22620 [Paenibacillus cisolokensis]